MMKTLNWEIMGTLLFLAIFAVVLSASPLYGEGVSVRRGIVQMKSGETGTGSPPGPFGDHWVHIQNNANVDSYDSRKFPYSETALEDRMDANVGCNVSPDDAAAGVSMNNNGTVSGDISVTTSESAGDILLADNSNFSGTANYNSAPWELLPITMPTLYTESGDPRILAETGNMSDDYEINNHNFVVTNRARVIFCAGQYKFDSFQLGNNVNFMVDENIGDDEVVEIFVKNSIQFDNRSILDPPILITGDTTKLRFYFDGTTTVDLSNRVTFYGFIYAPNAMIEVMNNMDIFGNLVGKEVWIWNNGGVHYDKALLGEDFGNVLGAPAAPHKRTDWKEIIVSD